MRLLHRALYCSALFLSIGVSVSPAQWVQTSGPGGGNISAIAVQGSNLFAGTQGQGVFLSTNNGSSWTAVNSGLTSLSVSALVANGTNLFAGTSGGAFLSTNGGTTWTAVNSGLTPNAVSTFLVSGTNLFAGTAGGGVYLSTNNGTSWTAVNSGLPASAGITAFASIGSNIFAAASDIYMSTNNGSSWTKADAGWPYTYINAMAASGSNLFISHDDTVYLSTNNGSTWTPMNSGITTYAQVTAFGIVGSDIFAGTNGEGVFLSTNNGTSWAALSSTNISPTAYVNTFAVSGSSLYAGTKMEGIFLSSDNGATWSSIGIPLADVGTVFVSGTNLFAGTKTGDIFRSTDGGASWKLVVPAPSGTGSYYGAAFAANGQKVVASSGTSMFLSTDNGASWTGDASWTDGSPVNALAFNGTSVFAGTNGDGIYRSTDNGTIWTGPSLPAYTYVNSLAVIGTDIFAATSGGLYRSIDNGSSWNVMGLVDSAANIAVGGTNLFVGSSGYGLSLSGNNGTSWTSITSGLPNNPMVSPSCYILALGVSGTDLFASVALGNGGFSGGPTDKGIFLSTDNGSHWKAVDSGLTDLGVQSLAANGTKLFAGTDSSGIWEVPVASLTTGVKESVGKTPREFSLSQSYPNPFNPTTVINYQIRLTSHVTLKVYDILGREVESLVDRQQTAGNYSVSFDGSNLPSGVYLYRLQAGNFSSVKKMMLLK